MLKNIISRIVKCIKCNGVICTVNCKLFVYYSFFIFYESSSDRRCLFENVGRHNSPTVDDRIPFLGDIPIIGRLFRSKYNHSQKRNLLIFVTARLVDPAGRPLARIEDTITKLMDVKADEDSAVPTQ